jgi:hypothetical protein
MANFMQQHNGRVKMVRNRFGGDNKRDHDSSNRRRRLETIIAEEQIRTARISLGDVDTTPTTPAGTRFCPIAQCPAPMTGEVRTSGGLTLRYEDGKLASASCRG